MNFYLYSTFYKQTNKQTIAWDDNNCQLLIWSGLIDLVSHSSPFVDMTLRHDDSIIIPGGQKSWLKGGVGLNTGGSDYQV